MEFKSLRNIGSSFRQIRLSNIVLLSLCAAVTVWSVWNSYRFAEEQRKKIHALDNDKSLMPALSQDLLRNRPAEAREHVRRFREMFFTLSPEKNAIEYNVKCTLLLADKNVYHYYSGFVKKGYYNRITAGNTNQVPKVDSVVCDFSAYPYRAVTYATQKIIRQSNATEHSLVTTCHLLSALWSDGDPNGFTIKGFAIIENRDLQTIRRQQDMKSTRKSIWGMHWKLRDKRKHLAANLRGYLDGSPSETRRCIVLRMSTTFAVFALYTFGRVVYDIGRNNGSHMGTGHVGRMELPTPTKTDNHSTPYLYGTGRE